MHLPKLSKKDAKRLFAAHTFISTSRDGMVISRVINVSPYKLHNLSQSDKWEKCLRFWGYRGDSTIKGKQYHEEINRKKVFLSLKYAERLWLELFNFKPIKELHKVLKRSL